VRESAEETVVTLGASSGKAGLNARVRVYLDEAQAIEAAKTGEG
jgi:hypothetical protein